MGTIKISSSPNIPARRAPGVYRLTIKAEHKLEDYADVRVGESGGLYFIGLDETLGEWSSDELRELADWLEGK